VNLVAGQSVLAGKRENAAVFDAAQSALCSPRTLMIALLVTGALFHISCALLMGLNRFVWLSAAVLPRCGLRQMLVPK
jgi:hypothetical protein